MKKIMIVEDDPSICQELKTILTNASYQVDVLKDFSNAKEEILDSNSNLALLDITIPL